MPAHLFGLSFVSTWYTSYALVHPNCRYICAGGFRLAPVCSDPCGTLQLAWHLQSCAISTIRLSSGVGTTFYGWYDLSLTTVNPVTLPTPLWVSAAGYHQRYAPPRACEFEATHVQFCARPEVLTRWGLFVGADSDIPASTLFPYWPEASIAGFQGFFMHTGSTI